MVYSPTWIGFVYQWDVSNYIFLLRVPSVTKPQGGELYFLSYARASLTKWHPSESVEVKRGAGVEKRCWVWRWINVPTRFHLMMSVISGAGSRTSTTGLNTGPEQISLYIGCISCDLSLNANVKYKFSKTRPSIHYLSNRKTACLSRDVRKPLFAQSLSASV